MNNQDDLKSTVSHLAGDNDSISLLSNLSYFGGYSTLLNIGEPHKYQTRKERFEFVQQIIVTAIKIVEDDLLVDDVPDPLIAEYERTLSGHVGNKGGRFHSQ